MEDRRDVLEEADDLRRADRTPHPGVGAAERAQERVTSANGIAIGQAVDDEIASGAAHDPRREEIPADEPRAMRRLAEPDSGAGPEVDQPDLPIGLEVDHLVGSDVRVTHPLEVLALCAWQAAPVPLEEQADRRAVAP